MRWAGHAAHFMQVRKKTTFLCKSEDMEVAKEDGKIILK
jgi:hypothetical protein